MRDLNSLVSFSLSSSVTEVILYTILFNILPLHCQLIQMMEFPAILSAYEHISCYVFLIFILRFLVPNFTLLVVFIALCINLLISIPTYIPIYLPWSIKMKEYLLGRQSVTVLYMLCFVFLFLTLPKCISKLGGRKVITKYNLAQYQLQEMW